MRIKSGLRGLVAVVAVAQASVAAAQDSLADPAGSGVIVSAVRWLEGTLLGTVATVVAVIAVATIGLRMLTGRIHLRYGATVILGCFLLFGAPIIAAGIQNAALGATEPAPVAPLFIEPSAPVAPSPPASVPKPAQPSGGYDPYAGAALPPH